jgi:hypothetical protein
MASEVPVGVASKGKGVLPPREIPWRAHAHNGSASGPSGRAAVPSGARAGAAWRARASRVGERVKEADRCAPPVIERKGKRTGGLAGLR